MWLKIAVTITYDDVKNISIWSRWWRARRRSSMYFTRCAISRFRGFDLCMQKTHRLIPRNLEREGVACAVLHASLTAFGGPREASNGDNFWNTHASVRFQLRAGVLFGVYILHEKSNEDRQSPCHHCSTDGCWTREIFRARFGIWFLPFRNGECPIHGGTSKASDCMASNHEFVGACFYLGLNILNCVAPNGLLLSLSFWHALVCRNRTSRIKCK